MKYATALKFKLYGGLFTVNTFIGARLEKLHRWKDQWLLKALEKCDKLLRSVSSTNVYCVWCGKSICASWPHSDLMPPGAVEWRLSALTQGPYHGACLTKAIESAREAGLLPEEWDTVKPPLRKRDAQELRKMAEAGDSGRAFDDALQMQEMTLRKDVALDKLNKVIEDMKVLVDSLPTKKGKGKKNG